MLQMQFSFNFDVLNRHSRKLIETKVQWKQKKYIC